MRSVVINPGKVPEFKCDLDTYCVSIEGFSNRCCNSLSYDSGSEETRCIYWYCEGEYGLCGLGKKE
ncbi:MAG: hypothetical protein ACOCXG_02875 [Nanoarchaeota archaeon]